MGVLVFCSLIVFCSFFVYLPLLFLPAVPSTTALVYIVSQSICTSADLLPEHHFQISIGLADTPSNFHADLSELVSPDVKYLCPKLNSSSFSKFGDDSLTPLAICTNFLSLL